MQNALISLSPSSERWLAWLKDIYYDGMKLKCRQSARIRQLVVGLRDGRNPNQSPASCMRYMSLDPIHHVFLEIWFIQPPKRDLLLLHFWCLVLGHSPQVNLCI